MPQTKTTVLFLCTGNCCRSQMCEAILTHVGGDRFTALSAGSDPAGFVHPLVIETIRQLGIPIGELRSKSWDEFADVPIDVVITVCDAAAQRECPVWHGAPLLARWPMPDPANHPGTQEERAVLALRVAERLHAKIDGLVALDWSSPRAELQDRLDFLGEI